MRSMLMNQKQLTFRPADFVDFDVTTGTLRAIQGEEETHVQRLFINRQLKFY